MEFVAEVQAAAPQAPQAVSESDGTNVQLSPRTILKIMTDPLDPMLSPLGPNAPPAVPLPPQNNGQGQAHTTQNHTPPSGAVAQPPLLPAPEVAPTPAPRASNPPPEERKGVQAPPSRSESAGVPSFSTAAKRRNNEDTPKRSASNAERAKPSRDESIGVKAKPPSRPASDDRKSKKAKLDPNDPITKAKQLRAEATSIKHLGDTLEHEHNSKEAIEFYLRAGMKFLESAMLMEKAGSVDDACTLYTQTASFFDRTAKMCHETSNPFAQSKLYAGLAYRCNSAAIARSFAAKPEKLRWLRDELHGLSEQAKPASPPTPPVQQQTSPSGTAPTGSPVNSPQPASVAAPAAAQPTQPAVKTKAIRELLEMVHCFDSWNKAEAMGDPPSHNLTSTMDYVRNALAAASTVN